MTDDDKTRKVDSLASPAEQQPELSQLQQPEPSHEHPLEQQFQVGQIIEGKYEIISMLGKGGMGVVYRVKQILINKELALKTIEKRCLNDTVLRRFQQEAKTSFSLDHPNIIKVNDFGLLEDGSPFLVMELVNGETLAERIKRMGCLSIEETIAIFIQVCFGLAYAHECGIVHRDIKPSNIMVLRGLPIGAEGSVKIVDFGIAKFTSHEGGEIQSLTRTGEIFGSPLYMSPEQCTGSKVDHRADVYSLGCVLFEALTGTPPFQGENALSTMIKHQSEPVPSLKEAALGLEFPPALEQIVSRMLTKSPDKRYSNLGVLAHDLSALRKGDSISQLNNAVTQATPKTISLHQSTFYSVIAATAVSFFAIGGVLIHLLETANNSRQALMETSPKRSTAAPTENAPSVDERKQKTMDFLKRELNSGARVEQLNLSGGTIPDEAIALIAETPTIKTIKMEDCTIPNDSLYKLSRLNLEKINVSYSDFNDTGAIGLSGCAKLVDLKADDTKLHEKGIQAIARKLKSLKNLSLRKTALSTPVMEVLSSNESLKVLDLREATGITAEGLSVLATSKIETLNLSGCRISSSDLQALCKIKSLKTLRLSNTNITASDVRMLVECHPNIKTMDVSHCTQIPHSEHLALSAEFPHVRFAEL